MGIVDAAVQLLLIRLARICVVTKHRMFEPRKDAIISICLGEAGCWCSSCTWMAQLRHGLRLVWVRAVVFSSRLVLRSLVLMPSRVRACRSARGMLFTPTRFHTKAESFSIGSTVRCVCVCVFMYFSSARLCLSVCLPVCFRRVRSACCQSSPRRCSPDNTEKKAPPSSVVAGTSTMPHHNRKKEGTWAGKAEED